MGASGMRRRAVLGLVPMAYWRSAAAVVAPVSAAPPASPVEAGAQVRPGQPLAFPRDFGAHPAFRTEWWYITGALTAEGARALGFQITFFRSRVDTAQHSPSRFAARQLIFAHAAVTDVGRGELLHDQRIAREGFGLAQAGQADTDVALRDWRLRRSGPVDAGRYEGRVTAREFALELQLRETQPLLLQGQQGYSRKGPSATQASYYYSQPHLAVEGHVRLRGDRLAVKGTAWLDHEWSESLLAPQAEGWDWIGMNLLDGTALTAFQLRRKDGSALWRAGSVRRPGEPAIALSPDQLRWTPLRYWRSPATGARYPVQWRVDLPGGPYVVRAVVDAQELDARQSTGGVYWEGLSELRDGQGRLAGRGYLEMTGYASRLAL